jgi:hypothetical protein
MKLVGNSFPTWVKFALGVYARQNRKRVKSITTACKTVQPQGRVRKTGCAKVPNLSRKSAVIAQCALAIIVQHRCQTHTMLEA